MPEVDFSNAIQPHRYARLRSGYKYQVFVDPEVFEHFGSAERVNEALRMLVEVARHGGPRRIAPKRRGRAA